MRTRPLCSSFTRSSLSFGAFLHPCRLHSFFHHALSLLPSVYPTLYSSNDLSIPRLDHALTRFPHPSPCPSVVRSSSPPLVSSIVLRPASLQLTALGHGAGPVQLHLVLLMLERWHSLLLSPPIASESFAVVLSSLSLFAQFIRLTLLSSVSASVAQFICLQGHSPLDAFILRSLIQFLLCSVHLSLVAVFLPMKIHCGVVRLHYICS